MNRRKQRQGTRQKFYRQIITVLLVMQTALIGVQGKIRIDRGDSPVEVVMWLINQYIPVLKQVHSLEDKDQSDLNP